MIKNSFFDTIENNQSDKQFSKKLWLTKEEFAQKYKISFSKLDKGRVLYSGKMSKQDLNSDINEYEYKLYDKYLVEQANTKIIGIMALQFVQIAYEENFDENNKNNDELPFFLFQRNQISDILVTDSIQEYYEWKQLLVSRCILNNFRKQYENVKILGKGTFAKVLLCRRKVDGKKYAVKIYSKTKINESKTTSAAIQGIQNEIKLMQALHHQNIIHLHEVYEGEFHIYLVLDLLTGGELFSKLHKIDNYSEPKACAFIKKLLEAIDYLHCQGIMHRDIKPENLIFRTDQSDTDIVLADFGFSEKEGKVSDLVFKRCGTPGYIAPEILNDQPYDTKVDIFSVGVIFYIILTGYTPFFGDSYDEIYQRNKKCQICFDFEQINLKLSEETMDLLKMMLKKDPKERVTAREALIHPAFKNHPNNNNNYNNDNNDSNYYLQLPKTQYQRRNTLKEQLVMRIN